jgi:hypothetical protein
VFTKPKNGKIFCENNPKHGIYLIRVSSWRK